MYKLGYYFNGKREQQKNFLFDTKLRDKNDSNTAKRRLCSMFSFTKNRADFLSLIEIT